MSLKKKKKLSSFAVLLLTVAFAIFMGACSDDEFIPFTPTEGNVDINNLNNKIAEAENAKTGVHVDTDAGNVALGATWVTRTEMDTFDNAINDAKQFANQARAATQADVNTAESTLNAAITAFNSAKKPGSKNAGFTIVELQALIAEAIEEKVGVEVNTTAANVDEGKYWVTQAVMSAFNATITAAENAVTSGTGIDLAYVNLSTAMTTFVSARGVGTKVAGPVTVDYGTTLSWGNAFSPTALGLVPGKTTTELNLNWLTSGTTLTGKVANVRFIEGTRNAGYALIEATGTVATATSSNAIYLYVTVTGLIPGKSYQYSVSDNGTNWSPMYDYKVPALVFSPTKSMLL
jgi:hypothetical protein